MREESAGKEGMSSTSVGCPVNVSELRYDDNPGLMDGIIAGGCDVDCIPRFPRLNDDELATIPLVLRCGQVGLFPYQIFLELCQ